MGTARHFEKAVEDEKEQDQRGIAGENMRAITPNCLWHGISGQKRRDTATRQCHCKATTAYRRHHRTVSHVPYKAMGHLSKIWLLSKTPFEVWCFTVPVNSNQFTYSIVKISGCLL